jgi:hypothetical protein
MIALPEAVQGAGSSFVLDHDDMWGLAAALGEFVAKAPGP